MWTYNYSRNQNELMHYGVLGMKWGVRRYQNYDGSYTQKGLKRYRDFSDKYEKSNAEYKRIKKENPDNHREIDLAKQRRNKDRFNMKSAYRNLKRDNRADKGKNVYNNGVGIKDLVKRDAITLAANTVIGLALPAIGNSLIKNSAAIVSGKKGYYTQEQVFKFANAVKAVSYSLAAANNIGAIASLIDSGKKKRHLRAYYSHTISSERK